MREGHWAVAERLLQQHAPLEQCDPLGRTPLMLAAAEGHVALIELLLDKGASMERIDRDGVTALGWACLRGRVQAAQCMLDRGAVVNHADKTGRTPLDLAALQVILISIKKHFKLLLILKIFGFTKFDNLKLKLKQVRLI